jgi:GT2 family glycosyltransferase
VSETPVLILNWNGWEDTFNCLRSIQATGEDHEVWLVDNASTADRTDEARTIYPGLRVVKWNDNYGWSGGYNRALRLAVKERYQFAYLLNNDSTVERGFLSHAVEVARADDRIATVGSYIAYPDSPEYLMFDGRIRNTGECRLDDASNLPHSVRSVSGAGMLVRLRAVEQDGYFDERYFCYCEEAEWCLRMADHGWLIIADSGSIIFHHGLRSDTNGNMQYYVTRNQFMMLERADYRRDFGGGFSLIYRTLRGANEARRLGSQDQASALAAGVYDGLLRRFGKRGTPPPAVMTALLTHCWPVRSGFFQDGTRLVRRLVSR